MFVAVRAIAPVAGMPPKRGDAMFAIPCPISSVLESCFPPVIPSATTALKRDSIAARTAMDTAVGKSILIVFKEKSGNWGAGRVFGITKCSLPSANVPIVSVFNEQNLSRRIDATVARIRTIKLPGIFFMNFDQMKMNARQTDAIMKEYKLSVDEDFMYTIILGRKSPGIFIYSSPRIIIGFEKSGESPKKSPI